MGLEALGVQTAQLTACLWFGAQLQACLLLFEPHSPSLRVFAESASMLASLHTPFPSACPTSGGAIIPLGVPFALHVATR